MRPVQIDVSLECDHCGRTQHLTRRAELPEVDATAIKLTTGARCGRCQGKARMIFERRAAPPIGIH